MNWTMNFLLKRYTLRENLSQCVGILESSRYELSKSVNTDLGKADLKKLMYIQIIIIY